MSVPADAPILTSDAMREAEAACAVQGTSLSELMELAGAAVADSVLAERRAAMDAAGWQPEKARPRKVSVALQAYAAMTTSAARGAVRDLSQLKGKG